MQNKTNTIATRGKYYPVLSRPWDAQGFDERITNALSCLFDIALHERSPIDLFINGLLVIEHGRRITRENLFLLAYAHIFDANISAQIITTPTDPEQRDLLAFWAEQMETAPWHWRKHESERRRAHVTPTRILKTA